MNKYLECMYERTVEEYYSSDGFRSCPFCIASICEEEWQFFLGGDRWSKCKLTCPVGMFDDCEHNGAKAWRKYKDYFDD